MPEQALSDLKVLDLSQHVSGPFSTRLLADYGADVIKIEPRGEGDPGRKLPPFPKDDPHPEKSGLFVYLNTNKRGITLNLKSPEGADIFEKMVKTADVVVENFTQLASPGRDLATMAPRAQHHGGGGGSSGAAAPCRSRLLHQRDL